MHGLVTSIAIVAGASILAACGGSSKDETASSSTAAGTAAPAASGTAAAAPAFSVMTSGVLTVGTELPDPPMVNADTYAKIKDNGYEVEMINELAKRLGVAKVKWVQFPFDGAIAGKPCPCDLYVDGVTIYPDRKEKVDFSSGYFKSNQGALARKGTEIPDLAAAKKLHWGVTKDSSGAFYMDDTIKPEHAASVYNDPTAANLALKAKQVDAIITDVSIAEDLAKKNTAATLVGQFETGEDYGIVLKKGSPNTAVVTQLVDQLKSDGFFDQLYTKYFPSQSKYSVIK